MVRSGPVFALSFATPSLKEGQAAPTMLGRYRRFGAAGGGEFGNRALLSLTTPIGGEAKVALHYLFAADVPSFGEGVAKAEARIGPELILESEDEPRVGDWTIPWFITKSIVPSLQAASVSRVVNVFSNGLLLFVIMRSGANLRSNVWKAAGGSWLYKARAIAYGLCLFRGMSSAGIP